MSVAAYMGIYGLIPLAAFIGSTIWALVKLFRVRQLLGEEKAFADMAIGGVVALLIGAVFEGYFLGTLTFPVFAIYLYLGFVNFGLDAVEVASHTTSMHAGAIPASALGEDSMQIPGPNHYVEQFV